MNGGDEDTIDLWLAELVTERLAGRPANLESLVAAHGDRADEIRARYADLERLSRLWEVVGARGGGPTTAGGHAGGAALAPGRRLGQFQIVGEIGRGGMGVIYQAVQDPLGRAVALKVIPASGLSPLTRQRFLREARALASLSHPHIVPVYAAGEQDGLLYMAMEYVRGAPLSRVIEAVRGRPGDMDASTAWTSFLRSGGPPGGDGADAQTRCLGRDGGEPAAPAAGRSGPVDLDAGYIRLCLETVVQVARALADVHAQGILHRDVKPANIILEPDGRARLLDFGLAAVQAEPHLTISGEFFGTPHYAAPEQAMGRMRQVGPASDVYSLGAALYECVTLRTPFEGGSAGEVLAKVAHEDLTPPGELNPALPRDVRTVIEKALAKNPAERYSSMADLADDIQRCLARQPIRARPMAILRRIGRLVRRRPRAAAAVAASVLAAAAALATWAVVGRPPPPLPCQVRLFSLTDGTILHEGDELRCGPQVRAKLALPPGRPAALAFYPDGAIAPGLRVRALAPVASADHPRGAFPAGSQGVVLGAAGLPADVPAAEAIRALLGNVPIYRIRWDGPPQAETLLSKAGFAPLLGDPSRPHETIALDGHTLTAAATVACCYLPPDPNGMFRGYADPPAADGNTAGHARARLTALLTALESLLVRAAWSVPGRTTASMEAPLGGGQPTARWEWRGKFDICGLAVDTFGVQVGVRHLGGVTRFENVPGPGGKPGTFVLDRALLKECPDLGGFDYFAALRDRLARHGVEARVIATTRAVPAPPTSAEPRGGAGKLPSTGPAGGDGPLTILGGRSVAYECILVHRGLVLVVR